MMMIVRGLLPGILLPVLTTIPSTILAISFKTLVDFDISGPPHRMVESILSTEFPGGTLYTVKKSAKGRYIIGMVRDGQEVLMDGDPTAMSRYILVHPRGDGMRYIRVTTRWMAVGNTFRTAIEEFVKRPEDGHYMPIIRTPIELDILSMDNTQYMDVNVLPGMAGGGYAGQNSQFNNQMISIQYSIKPEFWSTYSIGVVKYGDHLLEYLVDRLLERTVTWEASASIPIVTITSKYNDGVEVTARHVFANGEWRISSMNEKKKFLVA